ncbi:hypothetical protein [Acanthopleuribacter pedis]|uniref:Uncharacterized protein n=1 Tax=Acanthopleuribacter pedis TaxID=442870 RepID=A0A8J7QEP5_9BACT|nr:hypothetical protein [Acanthopleuribacter pedis]MBO1322899.1 hypothetical protein [Acanthopleuribacter pedis]
MTLIEAQLDSIPGICTVTRYGFDETTNEDDVLPIFIELPHGATEAEHLYALKQRIGDYKNDRYDRFFFVNTDQGSPEYAAWLAEHLIDLGFLDAHLGGETDPMTLRTLVGRIRVVVLRSLLPRTIVDVNRNWAIDEAVRKAANLTGTCGAFIKSEADLTLLRDLYEQYQAMARAGYAWACGNEGYAFNLHTYAPITVSLIEGEFIVDTLERAYLENYADYPLRPGIQTITTPPGEEAMLAPRPMVEAVEHAYHMAGFSVKRDEPYPLHPAATGYGHCARYPGRVFSMEVRRDLLVDHFEPFEIMAISPAKVAQVTLPFLLGVVRALLPAE